MPATLARNVAMRYHAVIASQGDAPLSRARKIQTIFVVAVLLLLAVYLAAGWYYSGEIEETAFIVDHEEDPFDLRVASVAGGRITLETTTETDSDGRWDKPGLWGLESTDTYNQVGKILNASEDSVVRELTALGPLPLVGDAVRINSSTYPGDPLSAHGIEFREIGIPAILGTFPAWLTLGESDTWIILVHGKGSDRRAFLRMLPMFVEKGYPTLTITYRNDPGLPLSPTGYYQYGADEWEDVEAAATFALAAGAKDLVLVGQSMGGGIVASFLYNSAVAHRVNGAILDGPALNFDALVDYGATQRRILVLPLPGALTGLAKFLATLRFGVDFDKLNYLKRAEELSAPILLFQGSEDLSVPESLSAQFKDARPDLVEYHPFEGAVHVGSWNLDPERYEDAVQSFLARLD